MRKKATIYVDSELLRAAKIQAAREEKADYQVIEDALRSYLGFGVLEEVWAQNQAAPLDEDASLDVAYTELKAARRSRSRR